MKNVAIFLCSFLLLFFGFTALAQDTTDEKLNLPGDNLNLYAVMKLFQESATLETFEKELNSQDSRINNLDLNNDNNVDYIKVIDYQKGDDHTIVLQVAVNEKENQDVAVFTVQKNGDDKIFIQLVGDEYLYGKDYIIEPNYENDNLAGETPNPGYSENVIKQNGKTIVVKRAYSVEVSTWPVITYIYRPNYVVWHSPWYWGYYPSYWSSWSPFYWDHYYGYHSHWNNHYNRHYRHCNYYRYKHWNDHYYIGNRTHSNTVYQHRQSGTYKNTYSRPDLRKSGSDDYRQRYAERGARSSSRNGVNEGEIRERSRQGDNQSRVKENINSRSIDRSENNRTISRDGDNQSRSKRIENRTEQRNGNDRIQRPKEDKKHEVRIQNERNTKRSNENKSAVKSEKRQSSPRQEKPNRSSESRKTNNSSETTSPRR